MFIRDIFQIGKIFKYKKLTIKVLEENMRCTRLFSTLSDFVTPPDCSPPGSSVRGIFQARTVEWVAISFSKHEVIHL